MRKGREEEEREDCCVCDISRPATNWLGPLSTQRFLLLSNIRGPLLAYLRGMYILGYLLGDWPRLRVARVLASHTMTMTGRATARSVTITLGRSNHLSLCFKCFYLSCPKQRNPGATSRTCSGIRTNDQRRPQEGSDKLERIEQRYVKPSIALGTFRRRLRPIRLDTRFRYVVPVARGPVVLLSRW